MAEKHYTALIPGTVDTTGKSTCAIGDPSVRKGLKFVERTPFLQSLFGQYAYNLNEQVVQIQDLPESLRKNTKVGTAFNAYKSLEGQGARLPKFSKWLASVYPAFKELHEAVALAMRDFSADKVIVSGSFLEMYNIGNSPHYASCLKNTNKMGDKAVYANGGGFAAVVDRVCSASPGLAVAYLLNPKTGFMKGRIMLQQVESQKYGNGIILGYPYGCLTQKVFISAWKEAAKYNEALKDVSVLGASYYGASIPDEKRKAAHAAEMAEWKFVGLDKDIGHWDIMPGPKGGATPQAFYLVCPHDASKETPASSNTGFF